MSRSTKIWLIVAASLVILGIIMFGVLMNMLNWKFFNLSTVKYETNYYEIDESFRNISIDVDTSDIIILPSDDGKVKVVCHELCKEKHSVSVDNDTLIINALDDRKWYDYINVGIDSPKITVYLPKTEYSSLVINEDTGDIEIAKDFEFESIDVSLETGNVKCYASATETVKIVASTGDVYAEGISASSIDLKTSTGDITASGITCDGHVTIGVSTGKSYLSNIKCKNLTSTGSTGDTSLTNVVATGKISIKRSTGNVTLKNSDAAELFITTDTGNVTGSLLTDKVFITKTNMMKGRASLP